MTQASLPLAGITVIEFTHMVMGPTVGLILADLGAKVIKIEPVKGDNTRRLKGSGAGYFPMYNRNKHSLCLDMKSTRGKEIARKFIKTADVLIENFRPGAMDKLGFGYDQMKALNPKLIYCSEKGFLSGPYEHRTALDEVTQMMGGLAYMTGPPGKPLRAGASVIDVTGGMFGAIAILAALQQRQTSGEGQYVKSALFETTAFLIGQHMAQSCVTGVPAAPMPVRISAWAIYQIFETKDNDQIFVGVVSDTQWQVFCKTFGLGDLAVDASLASNQGRVDNKDKILPVIKAVFKTFSKQDLMHKLDTSGLPFAPISSPEDMFTDPHLNANNGLVDVTLSDGTTARLPALPIEMNGQRMGVHKDLPKAGQDSAALLRSLGYSDAEIKDLYKGQIIGGVT